MTDFIAARNYTQANRHDCRLIVIHSMEATEKPGTARAVAKWFAGPNAPAASAHFCVDNVEVVQCVREQDVAWAAPGANRDGIHFELAGYARQAETDWRDEFSDKMLRLCAEKAAEIALKYDLPVVWLSVDEVKGGKARGFCGHHDVTLAFKKSTHTDPGPGFPREYFLSLVREKMLTGEELDAQDDGHPTDPAPPMEPEGNTV
jgi:hypothetical protein